MLRNLGLNSKKGMPVAAKSENLGLHNKKGRPGAPKTYNLKNLMLEKYGAPYEIFKRPRAAETYGLKSSCLKNLGLRSKKGRPGP